MLNIRRRFRQGRIGFKKMKALLMSALQEAAAATRAQMRR
jgi:hypothetical protein